jgi:Holliday junction resolvasome RuvABC DNA-binding subunit
VTLDGADKMIASLRKKVGPFLAPSGPKPAARARAADDAVRDDAVSMLVVMGVRRLDAQRAVDQLLGSREDITTVQDVVTEYLRARRAG